VVGTDAVLNYKVQIATTGQYRLYLRFSGYDGSSDSMYAQIVELIDGLETGQPDWYRYVGATGPNFSAIRDTAAGGSAIGWNGDGAMEGDLANQSAAGAAKSMQCGRFPRPAPTRSESASARTAHASMRLFCNWQALLNRMIPARMNPHRWQCLCENYPATGGQDGTKRTDCNV